MPVRQMKLRFDAKPTTRVIPSLLTADPPRGGPRGNKKASGEETAAPMRGVGGVPPPAAEAPPPAGRG